MRHTSPCLAGHRHVSSTVRIPMTRLKWCWYTKPWALLLSAPVWSSMNASPVTATPRGWQLMTLSCLPVVRSHRTMWPLSWPTSRRVLSKLDAMAVTAPCVDPDDTVPRIMRRFWLASYTSTKPRPVPIAMKSRTQITVGMPTCPHEPRPPSRSHAPRVCNAPRHAPRPLHRPHVTRPPSARRLMLTVFTAKYYIARLGGSARTHPQQSHKRGFCPTRPPTTNMLFCLHTSRCVDGDAMC